MTDLFSYAPPEMPPAQRHSATSLDAARSIREGAHSLRTRVLGYIVARGEHGATDGEIQQALRMEGSTQRPRRVELLERSLIRDSGRTRKTASGRAAVVWVAA